MENKNKLDIPIYVNIIQTNNNCIDIFQYSKINRKEYFRMIGYNVFALRLIKKNIL